MIARIADTLIYLEVFAMSRFLLPLAMALALPSFASASSKPCRDASGRVITCAKPAKPAAKRCKDAAGRFVPCDKAGARPAEAAHQ